MKNFSITKKVLSLVLTFLMLFSALSVSAIEWDKVFNDITTSAPDSKTGAHDHIYGEWVITTYPTCTSEGKRERKCIYASGNYNCDETYEEVLESVANCHVADNGVVIRKASCTEVGITEYKCKNCGVTYTVEEQMIDHVYDDAEWQEVVKLYHDKTKVQNGEEINNCTVCGKTASRVIEVEHEFGGNAATSRKEATCTTKGEEYKKCIICEKPCKIVIDIDPDAHVYSGKAFLKDGTISCQADGEGIAACENCGEITTVTVPKEEAHKYVEWTVVTELPEDANCLNGKTGYEKRICDTCGITLEANVITPAHEFNEEDIIGTVAPTCTTRGYQFGNCIKCGKTNVKNILPIDKDAHSWVEKVIKEPTCAENGILFKMCKYDSSHVVYEEIEKLEHTYIGEWVVVEPTCHDEGSKTNNCKYCGEITITLPIDPDAHVFDDSTWKLIKAPTCDEPGYEAATCLKCFGDPIEREIPKHSYTLSSYKRVEPTCRHEGKIHYYCYKCSNEFEEILPIDPDAHSPSNDYQVVKQPTCDTPGKRSKVCNYCRAAIEENQIEIPRIAHTFGAWETEKTFTCTENGLRVRNCTQCEIGFESASIPAAHRYTAWNYLSSDYNCTTSTIRERICLSCNEKDSETYYGDHVPGEWKFIRGNCTTGGVANQLCQFCKEPIAQKNVAAGQHVNLVKVGNAASSSSVCSGTKYQCTVCQEEVEEVVAHRYIAIKGQEGYPAACEKPGMTSGKYCAACGRVEAPKAIPALEHEFHYDDEGTKYCVICNLYYVDEEVTCNHVCHNNGTLGKILTKLLTFFWKLFNINQECACGVLHY